MNNKYFTATEIYARLLSSFPKKTAEINKIDVMRWCSEVITDSLRDPVGRIINKKIRIGFGKKKEVKDGRVPVPMHVYKLEAVYNERNHLIQNYQYNGEYIFFSDADMPREVYIDYYSILLDADSGFPLIKRGYELACYSYCVYKMFEEDASVIPPRIQQWRWLQIVQDKDWEIEAASRAWDDLDMNDIRDIHNYLISREYLKFVSGLNAEQLDGGSLYNDK